jgi:hypothetical protein
MHAMIDKRDLMKSSPQIMVHHLQKALEKKRPHKRESSVEHTMLTDSPSPTVTLIPSSLRNTFNVSISRSSRSHQVINSEKEVPAKSFRQMKILNTQMVWKRQLWYFSFGNALSAT